MWLSDLADFEVAWKTYAEARTAEMAGTKATGESKSKKRIKKVTAVKSA
jgi:hypothetical protein